MTRRLPIVSAALLAACLLGAPATSRAQVAVIRISSAEALLTDARTLAEGVLPAEPLQQVTTMLDQFSDPNFLKGLDRSRPLGALMDLPANAPNQPKFVAFLPIEDGEQLLTSIKNLGIEVDEADAGEFTHKLILPQLGGMPLYALMTPKNLFLTQVAEGAKALRTLDPEKLLPAKAAGEFLTASIRFDKLPADLKEKMLEGAEQAQVRDADQRPGEPDAQYQGRLAGMKLGKDGIASLLKEGRDLTLKFALDRGRNALTYELNLAALPGTALAATFDAFGGRRSRFQKLGDELALGGWLNVPMNLAMRNLIDGQLDKAVAKVEADAPDPNLKRRMAELVRSLRPTLTASDVDLGVALLGPFAAENDDDDKAKKADDKAKMEDEKAKKDDEKDDKDDDKAKKADDDAKKKDAPSMVALIGVKVVGGKTIEKNLRALVELAKQHDGDIPVELDVEKIDGTAVHKMTVEPKPGDNTAEIFGEPEIYLAIRDDVAMLALGAEGLECLKEALTAAVAPPGGPAAQLDMTMAASRLITLDKTPNGEIGRAVAAEVFANGDDHDLIRLRLFGSGGAMTMNAAVDLPVMKFVFQVNARQEAAKAAAAKAE